MVPDPENLLSFQEAMDLVPLPSVTAGPVRRFMATTPAYLPGSDYPEEKEMPTIHAAAFGGHVYAQSGLAAWRVWRELEDKKGVAKKGRLGLHSIHGFFTAAGICDRPFIYDVSPTSTSKGFSTVTVTAYQPTAPSTNPVCQRQPGIQIARAFPPADAALPVNSSPSFTAMCSFKSSEPHAGDGSVSTQEDPPQKRFADILASRKAKEWPPCPPVDIDGIVAMVGNDNIGAFPIAQMTKVDMTAYNEGKPIHERREIMLYRLRKPLPVSNDVPPEKGGYDANAHVLIHAYIADRNGLLMAGNHLGFGWSLGKAASLSYSFVVHVNVDDAVMEYGPAEREDVWWIQEMFFPRAAAGRGIIESKIWSPQGVHVATEYQDGLIRSMSTRPPPWAKDVAGVKAERESKI